MIEPLDSARAKKLIAHILKSGTFTFTSHAGREAANDKLNEQDCLNVLRGGWVEFSELVNGTWRYRVRTREIAVVIAFRSETGLVVITTWRLKKVSAEKKCLVCGGSMVTKRGRYDYGHVLPGVVLVDVLISRCKDCDETEVAIPRIEDLHRELAWKLVEKKGRLTPREVRYLRKHLGFSGADFAAHMGTRPETVSRWESGSAAMGEVADRLLRLMVVHQEPVKDYSLEALKGATAGAARNLKVQMKAGPVRGWKAA